MLARLEIELSTQSRMAPPTISEKHTTHGLNSKLLMYCRRQADDDGGQERHQHADHEARGVGIP